MEIIKPKKLEPGDTIGVFAPSSWVDPTRIQKAVDILKLHEFNVVIHEQCLKPAHGTSAGSVEEKVSALHDLFLDPAINVVFCTKGGQEAIHLLDRLDYDLIARNPKILLGFSDTTALLTAIAAKSSLVTFHGPHLVYFGNKNYTASAALALKLLSGNWQEPLFPKTNTIEVLQSGTVEGKLVGGNFPLLTSLLLSGYMPELKNSILIIETIGKEIAYIDQYLGALKLAGVFKQVSGIIFGYFSDLKDTPNSSGDGFNKTIYEVIQQNIDGFKGPVIFNAPIGHDDPNITWPLSVSARMEADGGKANLTLLESPFADA